MKFIKRLTAAFLALGLAASPVYAAYQPQNVNGQASVLNSSPVTQAAPNNTCATVFQSPHAASAYGINQLVANSATAASVTPMSFVTGLTNGLSVNVTSGTLKVATSSAFTTAAASSGGYFLMQLYGVSPGIPTNGDGGGYKTANTNWCGTLACTLSASVPDGQDYSIANCTPFAGTTIDCTPGGSSNTIFGLLQTGTTTWTPSTTTYNYQACVNLQ